MDMESETIIIPLEEIEKELNIALDEVLSFVERTP